MSSLEAQPLRQPQEGRGKSVTVRPLGRDDGARLQAYVRALSPQARYNRFLGAVSELPQAELERIANGAGATLIAETNADENRTIVAEARYAIVADGRALEFAVSVADDWRGRGLATALLDKIECRARELGAAIVIGDVLRTNMAMQQLARHRGFRLTNAPYEARLVRIVKDISRSETPCGESVTASLPLAA